MLGQAIHQIMMMSGISFSLFICHLFYQLSHYMPYVRQDVLCYGAVNVSVRLSCRPFLCLSEVIFPDFSPQWMHVQCWFWSQFFPQEAQE